MAPFDFRRAWRRWGWRVSYSFRRFDRVQLTRWHVQLERGMNGCCYCDQGFWLRLELPMGFVWLEGDTVARPCSCDVALHELLHDDESPDCCAVGEARHAGSETA